MKRIFLSAFAVLIALLFGASGHPYYLSVTDLKYNGREKALEGSVKVFVHDLETALRKSGHSKIDLINAKDRKHVSSVLGSYLAKRLALTANGKPLNFELIGFEHEGEHLWMHVTFRPCRLPGEVRVVNTILYDHFKEQINIVHVEFSGDRQSGKLANPEKETRFTFR